MTDNEIIKALECCAINQNCNGCPHYANGKPTKECLEITCKNALDLINRQKENYEALKAHEEKEHRYCKNECEPKHKAELKEANRIRCRLIEESGVLTKISDELYQKIKVAEIKKFWGELKKRNTMDERIVSVASGDNLVKEMVGAESG